MLRQNRKLVASGAMAGKLRNAVAALSLVALSIGSALAAGVPPPSKVVDLTGTLSSEDRADLLRHIALIEREHDRWVEVLVVRSTDGLPIEQYAKDVLGTWAASGSIRGPKGVVLVLAKEDRKFRIETQGLQDELGDEQLAALVNTIMPPHFKAGDFHQGLRLALWHFRGAFKLAGLGERISAAPASRAVQVAARAEVAPEQLRCYRKYGAAGEQHVMDYWFAPSGRVVGFWAPASDGEQPDPGLGVWGVGRWTASGGSMSIAYESVQDDQLARQQWAVATGNVMAEFPNPKDSRARATLARVADPIAERILLRPTLVPRRMEWVLTAGAEVSPEFQEFTETPASGRSRKLRCVRRTREQLVAGSPLGFTKTMLRLGRD